MCVCTRGREREIGERERQRESAHLSASRASHIQRIGSWVVTSASSSPVASSPATSLEPTSLAGLLKPFVVGPPVCGVGGIRGCEVGDLSVQGSGSVKRRKERLHASLCMFVILAQRES